MSDKIIFSLWIFIVFFLNIYFQTKAVFFSLHASAYCLKGRGDTCFILYLGPEDYRLKDIRITIIPRDQCFEMLSFYLADDPNFVLGFDAVCVDNTRPFTPSCSVSFNPY